MERLERQLASLSPEQRRLVEHWLHQQQEGTADPSDMIPRRHTTDTAPLSFAQQRLWFLHQLAPDSPAYNLRTVVRLVGQLDLAVLAGSLNAIMERHEVLRTTFVSQDGQPQQIAAPTLHLSLPLADLGAVPLTRREALIQHLALAATEQPFDLAQAPLLRVRVLRLGTDEHVLLLAMHHIISDGWSQGVQLRELMALYGAFVQDQPSPLPELPIQYADYACWQRELLQGSPLEDQLAYWKGQLEQTDHPLNLPTDRPRPPMATYRGAWDYFTFPAPVLDQLKELSRRESATLFMTLLAALDALLYRYTGQTDLVVGTPVAGRNRSELEGLIGCFVNTLVLRVQLGSDPPFLQLLQYARNVTIEAYAHQDMPFEKLVEELRLARDLSRNPIFQMMLVLQNAPMPALEGPGLSLLPMEANSTTSIMDLSLQVHEQEEALLIRAEYNTDLFDDVTIRRMIGHFHMLLEGIVADPDQRLSALPLLTEGERWQLLAEWNGTGSGVRGQGSGIRSTALHKRRVCLPRRHQGTKLPKHARILVSSRLRGWYLKGSAGRRTYPASDLLTSDSWLLTSEIELQATRTPDAVAVVFDESTDDRRPTTDYIQDKETRRQGDKEIQERWTDNDSAFSVQLTYAELNRRANQLAHYLRRLGVGPETLVGIGLERSVELVVGLLGILKAGGAYMPLDPSYPAERLAFMLEDARVAVLITQRSIYDLRFTIYDLEESQTEIVNRKSKIVNINADWPIIAQQPATSPNSGVTAEHPAYVIYTSGSTGRPKGVINTHAGIRNRLRWMQGTYCLTEADRVVQKTPCSFDVSVWELFWPLMNGAGLVLARPEGHKDSDYLARLIADQRISIAHFVPSMLQVFLEEPALDRCRCLRLVICSGEALSVELQRRFFTRMDAALHNLYGPTEAAIDVTFWACERMSERQTVPIGRPIANTQIYLLDGQLQPVPIGVPGELHIGGVGLARGYLGRPNLTAERFIPNPFAPPEDERRKTKDEGADSSFVLRLSSGTRLYKTGDLARYLPDGTIAFLGRIDHQVKLRGFRIELDEIEAVLGQQPAVCECVVLAREDVPGGMQLVAYVVPTNDQPPTTNDDPADKETGRQGDQAASNLLVSLSPGLISQSPSFLDGLRDYLRQTLPDYMVPSTFVLLDVLPLTPNGKLDRRALLALGGDRPDLEAAFVGPRTLTEQMLAELWAHLLGLERVGIHDSFFALGGHSLQATQVMARVRDAFHVELPLRALFEAPTIAALAARVEARSKLADLRVPSIRPVARAGGAPLSYGQERMWRLDQLDHDKAVFNMLIAIHLTGALDVWALRRSFAEIARRHETLRTTFAMRDGGLVQIIAPDARLPLPVLDLRSLPPAKREAVAQRLATEEAQRPFDLAHDHLARTTLLRLDAEEHRLLLAMHHIVSDGWSFGVLFRELAPLYAAFSRGRTAELPELPIQYADFAIWQRQVLRKAVLDARLAYWQKRLANLPPSFGPRPTTQSAPAARHPFVLSPQLSASLRALSQREEVFLFITLLTAFKLALARCIGQDDIIVGVSSANRDWIETKELIGFFANMLVLRTDLSGQPTFEEALRRVRSVYFESYGHRDLPIEKLLEALQHEHIEVVFNFLPGASESIKAAKLEDLAACVVDLKVRRIYQFANLVLMMRDSAEGLYGSLTYKTDLFDAGTIQRFADSYLETLEALVSVKG